MLLHCCAVAVLSAVPAPATHRKTDRQIRKRAPCAHYQAPRPLRSGAYRLLPPRAGSPIAREWEPFSSRPSRGETATDGGKHQTDSTKRRRRVSSVVLDTSNSGIVESPRATVPNGREPGSPGVHRRSGRRWTPQRSKTWCKTTGKSLPRSSAPRLSTHDPLPPRQEAKSAGKGTRSRRVHRRAQRRWTGPTAPRTVQNDEGESLPPFCTGSMPRSANPLVVGCDSTRWGPSPGVHRRP